MANALYGRCEANKPLIFTRGRALMIFTPAQFWPTYWLDNNRIPSEVSKYFVKRVSGSEARKILIQFKLVDAQQRRRFDGSDYIKVLRLRMEHEKVKAYYIPRNSSSILLSTYRGDSFLSVNCKSALTLDNYSKPGVKAIREKIAIETSMILFQRRSEKIRNDDSFYKKVWLHRKIIIAGSVAGVFIDSLASLLKLGYGVFLTAERIVKWHFVSLFRLASGDRKAVENDIIKFFGDISLGIKKLEKNLKLGYSIVETIWGDTQSRELLFAFMKEYVDGTSVVNSATFKIALTIDVLLIIGTLGAGAVVVGARLGHRVGQFTVRALNFIVELYRALKLSKATRIIESKLPVKRIQQPKDKSAGSVGSENKASTAEKNVLANTKQTGSGKFTGSADQAYDSIRKSTTDVNSIAKNTGIKPENIQKVKNHVFYKEHVLDRYVDYGIPAEKKRFDSDTGMANAWKRLENGTYTDNDIKLLKHEVAESWYMKNNGPGYNSAHNAAEKRYPAPNLEGN